MGSKWEIIFGPPGCGKTHSLISRVSELLADDVAPSKIAYLAFTRGAARLARARAQERFNFTDKELAWFRTIHSLAFKQVGARAPDLLHRNDYAEIANRAGFDFTGEQIETETELLSVAEADAMFFIENRARLTGESLADLWHQRNDTNKTDRFKLADIQHLKICLDTYKEAEGKKDFTSILNEFVMAGVPPAVDVILVDEAQDLSRLQWQAIEKLAAKARLVVVAGDDDQAVFKWAGADVDHFQALQGQRTILDQSYRVPQRAWKIADEIIHRVHRRQEKQFNPTTEQGTAEFIDHDSELNASKGNWLFLARHTHQMRQLKRVCQEHGWFYTCKEKSSNKTDAALAVIAWENLRRGFSVATSDASLAMLYAGHQALTERLDAGHPREPVTASDLGVEIKEPWTDALYKVSDKEASYFMQARREGEAMAQKDPESGALEPAQPRIRISTIHGAKGAEAEGVYLLTDISESTAHALGDDEHRVAYVAVTRTMNRLVVQRPETFDLSYPIPEINE